MNGKHNHGKSKKSSKPQLSEKCNDLLNQKIELDYTQNKQLFGDYAECWSKKIDLESNYSKNKINQIRMFYDKVAELNQRAQNISDSEFKQKIYPFVIMLRSKIAYAKTRGLVSDGFEKMMTQCIDSIDSTEKMNNFKLFFEAVIGFYPKK